MDNQISPHNSQTAFQPNVQTSINGPQPLTSGQPPHKAATSVRPILKNGSNSAFRNNLGSKENSQQRPRD